MFMIDFTRASFARVCADGRIGTEVAVRWFSQYLGEIIFFYFPVYELTLQFGGKMASTGQKYYASGVGIQSVRRSRFGGIINGVQNILQRIAIEAAARMHRQ